MNESDLLFILHILSYGAVIFVTWFVVYRALLLIPEDNSDLPTYAKSALGSNEAPWIKSVILTRLRKRKREARLLAGLPAPVIAGIVMWLITSSGGWLWLTLLVFILIVFIVLH